jgi:hypothetical protein
MKRTLHVLSLRQSAFLAATAIVAVSTGYYLRYEVIEQTSVGIACGNDLDTWLCASRRATIALFTPQLFGLIALWAALLNLLRPSMIFWAATLLTGGIGIVLYNVTLSSFAVTFLVLSLARPGPELG